MALEHATTYRLDGGGFPLEPVMLIDPLGFGRAYAASIASDTIVLDGGVVRAHDFRADLAPSGAAPGSAIGVVHVRGPLSQRAAWVYDGYDRIRARFEAALADPGIGAVILAIDSPGGHAAGNFEMVAAMRAAKLRAKKPVYAFADELAASAAYALATVADEIHVPPSGVVGSVGVIAVVMEASKLLADIGLRFHLVKTGEAKGDAHPAFPLSEEALARMQARIDELGGLFFDLVASARGLKAADVKALEAQVFTGKSAVAARLADSVSSFDGLVLRASERLRAVGVRMERNMTIEKNGAAESGTGGQATASPPDHKPFALALGLNHDASEDQILTSISEMRRERAEVLRLTGKATAAEALGAIQAGQIALQELTTARAELGTLRAKESARSIDAAIEQAKAEGKITSDAFEHEMRALGAVSHERMTAVLGALPVAVTTPKTQTAEPPTVGLSAEEAAVAKQLGLNPEQVLNTKREKTSQKGG